MTMTSKPKDRAPRSRLRRFAGWVLYAVLWFLLLGEVGARLLSRHELGDLHLLQYRLLPLPRLANGLTQRLQEDGDAQSYVMADRSLGWVLRPGTKSSNGLFFSNRLGFRDAATDLAPDLNDERVRVLLLGDSFAHGDELVWEDTWAYHLGAALGDRYSVLNAGVPGYGTDQAYLRGEMLAPTIRPKITILTLCRDDLWRNVNVFRSLYHHWTDFPWTKPRFMLDGSGLRLVNSPTLPEAEIIPTLANFSGSSLRACESCYWPGLYEDSIWHRSRLLQYLISKREYRNRHDALERLVREDGEAILVTARILAKFQNDARARGTRPVIVLLPSATDLGSYVSGGKPKFAALIAEADRMGVAVLDMGPVVAQDLQPGEKTAVFFVGGGGHPNARSTKLIASRLEQEVLGR